MLSQSFRLNQHWRIKKTLNNGKQIHAHFFSIFYIKNKSNKAKATVIVSKKYDKRAVYRNKLKRKYQEALHSIITNLQLGIDIVVLPKYQFDKVDFYDLQNSLEKCVKHIGKFLINS